MINSNQFELIAMIGYNKLAYCYLIEGCLKYNTKKINRRTQNLRFKLFEQHFVVVAFFVF